MTSKFYLDRLFKDEFRPMGFLKPTLAFHFHVAQFTTFAYLLIRVLSRNFSVYGDMLDSFFNYPRKLAFEIWPVQASHFFTFQFIYDFLPRPSPETILGLQVLVAILALAGLLGIFARWCALASFLIYLHFTGFVLSSNAELEGGCVLLMTLLIFSLCPQTNFYSIFKRSSWSGFGPQYSWPIYLMILSTGLFYSYGGLNKLFDVGFDWPFLLSLDNLAAASFQKAVFTSSRLVEPLVSYIQYHYVNSTLAGFVTLAGELFFITALFLPRYRFFFVSSMVVLHFLVYWMAGINFTGSSFILLLCCNWNSLATKLQVYVPDDFRFKEQVMKLCSWRLIAKFVQVSAQRPASEAEGLDERLQNQPIVKDNMNETYYGYEAVEYILSKHPIFYPLVLIGSLPIASQILKGIYYKLTAPLQS